MKRDRQRLEDILEAIERIEKYASGGRESFDRDELVQTWIVQEDEAFIAEVPELPGCAADGPTYAEAIAAAEVAIRDWLETAKELGRDIPEARGRLAYA